MFVFLFFIPILSFSSVIQDDVSTTDKFRFPFKEVCQKMVTHESPLIEVVSGTELDCMGKKIHVGEFCDKELAYDPYYLRAFIDRDKKEVVCHSGKKVFFKYQCDTKLCDQTAELACTAIKQKLAKRLDITLSSYSKNEKGIKILNCNFESLPLKKKSL